MWYLTNIHTDKVVFVKPGKTTIGRKGSQIELENDQSLSRIHACLILEGEKLKVQDAKSKYGTYLNGNKDDNDKINPEEQIPLKDGDSVQFGKFNNEWNVHKIKYKTAISMLDQEKRDKLTKILKTLGIQLAGDFDSSCSHLTMPMKTDVSHKLLQALTLCKPVVNPKFWLAFQEAYENNQPLPKYLEYLPKVKEDTFVSSESISLAMNENRQKVFNGKLFIFFSSSQMGTFEDVITNGGGKCVSISKTKVTLAQCCAKRSVVIVCKDNATQSMNDGQISKIREALSKKKRRMVPELEIGMAILHASAEKFTNPEHQLILPTNEPSLSQIRITKSKILVHESIPNSEIMGPPSKKPRQAVQEVINLDSDDEEEKENCPRVVESQVSDGIVLPETQVSRVDGGMEASEPRVMQIEESQTFNEENIQLQEEKRADQEQNIEIPETQESFVSAVSQTEFSERRTTRSSSRSPQKTNKSLANVSLASAPMSEADLFNFTSTSNSKITRKRKNSETTEVPVASTSKKPTAKKTRMIVDENSDEEIQQLPIQKPQTKKRQASAVGGLFVFDTNFAKRLKPAEESQDVNDSAGPSGIIPIPPRATNPPRASRTITESDDSCDTGVWLSRAMTSVSIEDDSSLINIVKTEPIELKFDSEDIKLPRLPSFFNVLETTDGNSTTSSMISKRKQFVKKQNFKPQNSVVTMKVIRVADTLTCDDDF